MSAGSSPGAIRRGVEWLRGTVGLRRHLPSLLRGSRSRPGTAAGRSGRETPRRLNWSVGPVAVPGWLNVHVDGGEPWDVAHDIRGGIPIQDGAVDYAVSIHALAEIPYRELVPVLAELHRVIAPGGVLRIAVPDLVLLHDAYRRGDAAVFEVPDEDAARPGAKLVTQVVWYGLNRTPFTFDALEELLTEAGFRGVTRRAPGETGTEWPDIAALDGRERVSLFAEARR